MTRSRPRVALVAAAALACVGAMLAGCGSAAPAASKGVINAIGTENEYANVLSQIGGKYVHVSSILNNPNTDPHTFEASTTVAQEVGSAQLIIQNGMSYDTFMNQIEAAAPLSGRKIIDVQTLLGMVNNASSNPHLWYNPRTMPTVGAAIVSDLSAMDPSHAAYFEANLTRFDASLQPWITAIAQFKARYAGTPVAVTEPVADYMLQAMGMDIKTPWTFQADIMNGVDPAPELTTLEEGFFTSHEVKVFCYNQQVVDSLTTSIREIALGAGVPVVGVYETMPTPGYDYQTWMMAELNAIKAAIQHGTSTQRL